MLSLTGRVYIFNALVSSHLGLETQSRSLNCNEFPYNKSQMSCGHRSLTGLEMFLGGLQTVLTKRQTHHGTMGQGEKNGCMEIKTELKSG